MPQDFDVDKFMAGRRKPVTEQKQPAGAGDFDVDAFMEERRQPQPRTSTPVARSTQTPSRPPAAPESNYGPLYESLVDQGRRSQEAERKRKQAEFEQKPVLEQWYERGKDALNRGLTPVMNAMTTVPSIPSLLHSRQARETGDKALARWQAERAAGLAERQANRPEGGLATQIGEGILEAAPSAALLAATGGESALATALTGGAYTGSSIPAEQWRQAPGRSAVQTGIGAIAPIVGGRIGQKVAGAAANRLASPAAKAVTRAVGEVAGGGTGNVLGSSAEKLAFEGRLPTGREATKEFLVGGAMTAPGAVRTARRSLPPPAPQPRTPEGAIIAPESPIANRKLLAAGNPEEVPTARLYQAEPPPRGIPMPPSTQELTPETFGYVPRRKSLPAGNPEEIPTARLSQPTERLQTPDAPETQEMPALKEWMARENAPTAEIPRVSTGETERRVTAPEPGESGLLQTSVPGRPVTQEYQLPPGPKASETHASREDARQGHFERFSDEELVDEIRRMEDVQNQATRGRSKLSPEELESNRFDLKVAVGMQKERLRLQRQIGIDPANRIAPRTPARPPRKIQHTAFGEVTEAADQAGVPKGKLKVVDADGGEHTIQNPRTRGNQNASFARSTGPIPAEAMPEMEGKTETPIRPGPRQSYAIPDEAMPELRGRGKGHIMGGGLGGLQGLFEGRAKLPKPGQRELFKGAPKGKKDNENAGLGSMIGGALRTASQGLRTFKTAFDLSAPLSQGAFLTRAHPLKGAQAFGKMIRSLKPSQSAAIDKEILNHPLRKLGDQFDLHIATGGAPEEAFMLGKLNKAPGIAASERTYRTYLDSLRLSVWESYVKSLQASGHTPDNNPKAYRQAAQFINIATGRGSLKPGGKLANAMALGGDVLFAPRNLASKFQLLDPVRYAKLAPGARKIVLRDAATSFGSIMGTALLLREAGARVGIDPRDDDFMEARWGNHRFDLTAGLKTEVKFLAKMIAGSYNKANGERNLPGQDPLDVAKNYARGKLAPGPGFVYDALKGQDFKGQKLSEKSATDLAFEFGPMILEDLKEGYEDSGITGALKSSPSFIGQRVSVRPDRAKAAWLTASPEVGDELRKLGIPRPYLGPKRARKSGEKDETFDEFNARHTRFAEAWSRMSREMIDDASYRDADDATKAAAFAGLKRHLAGLGKEEFEEKDVSEIVEAAISAVEKRRAKEER